MPSEERNDEPLVVFVHIRKTAGKTLRQVLYRQYRRRNTRLVKNYFTDPTRSFVSVSDLAASPKDLRALHGHMLFWPELAWPEGTRFVTILRDPVERTLSHYYWLRARSDRYTKTLDEALVDGSIHDNLQTRVISGEMPGLMELGDDALATAVERLDRFAVVGLTDRFDESLALMTQVLGWRWQSYRRENITPGRKPRDEIAPETIARIEEMNRLDRELYRQATARFEADLAGQDEAFAVELDALRAAVAAAAQVAEDAPLELDVPPAGSDLRSRLVAARAEVLLRESEIERLHAVTRDVRKRERGELRPRPVPKGLGRFEGALETAQQRLAQIQARIDALEQELDPSADALATLERKAEATRARIAALEQRRATRRAAAEPS